MRRRGRCPSAVSGIFAWHAEAARDAPALSSWNKATVYRQIMLRLYCQKMVHRIMRRALTAQVPICMIGQINARGGISRRAIGYRKRIICAKLIGCGHFQIAGIALIATGAKMPQRDRQRRRVARRHCPVGLIKPHIAAMRAAIASRMGLDPDQVGVKATTNEQLGAEGREEGISCHAVALIQKG